MFDINHQDMKEQRDGLQEELLLLSSMFKERTTPPKDGGSFSDMRARVQENKRVVYEASVRKSFVDILLGNSETQLDK